MASLIQEETQSNVCMTFESSVKNDSIKYIKNTSKIINSTIQIKHLSTNESAGATLNV